jgi:hypothetical protein
VLAGRDFKFYVDWGRAGACADQMSCMGMEGLIGVYCLISMVRADW